MSEPLGISPRDAVRLRNMLIAFEQGRLNTALPAGWHAPGKGQDTLLGYLSASVAAGATGTAVYCTVDGTPTVTQLPDLANTFTIFNPGPNAIPAGYIAMMREPSYGYWLGLPLGTPSDPVFGASGPSHSSGDVPDPGATAGTLRFLREDATWQGAAQSVYKQYTGTTTFTYITPFDVTDLNGLHGSFTFKNTHASYIIAFILTLKDVYGNTVTGASYLNPSSVLPFSFEATSAPSGWALPATISPPWKECSLQVEDDVSGSHATFDIRLSLVGTPTGY